MVAKGPYVSNSVWNLLDTAMESSSPLFAVKELSNILRALNEEDQKRFTFAMTRVLSLGRLQEARYEGLFKSLREAYEALQDMDVKTNQLKRQRNEARRDMENVRDDLLQAQAEFKSFEDQREEEREENQRDALQSREFFEKMVANI